MKLSFALMADFMGEAESAERGTLSARRAAPGGCGDCNESWAAGKHAVTDGLVLFDPGAILGPAGHAANIPRDDTEVSPPGRLS